MQVLDRAFDIARKKNYKIVFPENDDERIVDAAKFLSKERLAEIIWLDNSKLSSDNISTILKIRPSITWGKKVNLLNNGYRNTNGIIERLIKMVLLSKFINITRPRSNWIKRKKIASKIVIFFDANGLFLVLSTFASYLWSKISLIVHPAPRIIKEPKARSIRYHKSINEIWLRNETPQKHGHIKRKDP